MNVISRFDHIEHIEKFNPYHDRLGRFATASGAASFTVRTKDPKKQHMADLAIAREKERAAAAKPKLTPKENLVTGLGQEHAENIERIVSEAPDHIRNAWEKYGNSIIVGDSMVKGTAFCKASTGAIHVNIERDSEGSKLRTPYETTMHESGHSIDHAISKHVGYKFADEYKEGLFEKTIIKEAETYIKNKQKQMSVERGDKVSIAEAREAVGKELKAGGFKATSDVSDMFEGATKGKVIGSGGHGKKYWTGYKAYGWSVPGHKVSSEAFAEMFSATLTNADSLVNIKKYFPESYSVFTEMLGGL